MRVIVIYSLNPIGLLYIMTPFLEIAVSIIMPSLLAVHFILQTNLMHQQQFPYWNCSSNTRFNTFQFLFNKGHHFFVEILLAPYEAHRMK